MDRHAENTPPVTCGEATSSENSPVSPSRKATLVRRYKARSPVRAFHLSLDPVAQNCHAVFERGGFEQQQVLPILENARSLAP